jgi:hypothetical protein
MNVNQGDVVYLDAGGQPIVILGSQRAAVELLERRGAIYSSRPKSHMLEMCVRLDIRRFPQLILRRQVRRRGVLCY